MTRAELLKALHVRFPSLTANDIEAAVKTILDQISKVLSQGGRSEIRGFGSFTVHVRPPRLGRNPKTGEKVAVPEKRVPYFKPGQVMRERVNTVDAKSSRKFK